MGVSSTTTYWVAPKKYLLLYTKRGFHQRGYKMLFQEQPNTKVIQPMAMWPPSGDCIWAMWEMAQSHGKHWDGRFVELKFKFTIFCRSKVFPPQCGPRSAGTGSPWEWRGRALEMRATLKWMEHLISMTIQTFSVQIVFCLTESFWNILFVSLLRRVRWEDRLFCLYV